MMRQLRVLAGMIAMSESQKFAIPLARHDPKKEFSFAKIFDDVIRDLADLRNLNERSKLRRNLRHLLNQKNLVNH
jgi:hypothetical protein